MNIENELQALRDQTKMVLSRLEFVLERLRDIESQLEAINPKHDSDLQRGEQTIRQPNLAEFKRRISDIRRKVVYIDSQGEAAKYTQRQLAMDIGLNESELASRLSGKGKVALNCQNVRAIIVALAKHGGIQSKDVADELIELMNCPGFTPEELVALDDVKVLTTGKKERLEDDLFKKEPSEILLQYGLDDLRGIILDETEKTSIRLKALDVYIPDDPKNRRLFNTLAVDPDLEIRKAVANHIRHNDIAVDLEYLNKMMNDDSRTVSEVGVLAARHMIENGKLPLSFLTNVSAHKYWLVRLMAIRHIVEVGSADSIKLLYEFRSTSYHVSQQKMRDYIIYRCETGGLGGEEYRMSIEILEEIIRNKRSSEKTIEKTKVALEKLKTSSCGRQQSNDRW